MDVRLRTTRTLKVTDTKLTEEQLEMLAQLCMDARYQVLLDVMERGCIELETAHFNTSLGNPEEILGGHAVAKAAWLFFQYIQKQVIFAHRSRAAEDDDEPHVPPTLEEFLQGVE